MNTADVIVKGERVTDGDEQGWQITSMIKFKREKKGFKRTVEFIPIRQYLEHTNKTVSS